MNRSPIHIAPRSVASQRVRTLCIGLLFALAWAGPDPARAEPVPVTADVMFLYTPDVTARYGSGVETRIDHLVAVANDAFERSEAGIRLRAVHAREVDYPTAPDSGDALYDVTFNRGVFAGVEELRTEVGADLVVLLRPYNDDGSCGIAWIGGFGNGDLSSSNRYAYSTVSVDCSDYVLGHELGHNLGLTHSRRQDGEGGAYPWSLGHGVNGSFVTMMAYGSSFQNAPKLHLFSSPLLTCSGVPCGIARSQSANNSADAADSLRNTVSQVALYRAEQGPAPEPATLAILGPNTRSLLEPGGTYPISWDQTGVETVDLSSRIEGREDFDPIAQGVAGTRYTWSIPAAWSGLTVRVLAEGFDAAGVLVASGLTPAIRVDGERIEPEVEPVREPTTTTEKKKKKKKKKKKRKKKRKKKKKKRKNRR